MKYFINIFQWKNIVLISQSNISYDTVYSRDTYADLSSFRFHPVQVYTYICKLCLLTKEETISVDSPLPYKMGT